MFPKQTLRWLGIGLGVVLVGYVVYRSQTTLVLPGISFVTAYLLDPCIDRLECLGLSRTLATMQRWGNTNDAQEQGKCLMLTSIFREVRQLHKDCRDYRKEVEDAVVFAELL